MQWGRKDEKDLKKDGTKCGNYKLSIPVSRICAPTSEDEYFDFNFIGSQMRIEEAEQHDDLSFLD
jgi:hypothetical protein